MEKITAQIAIIADNTGILATASRNHPIFTHMRIAFFSTQPYDKIYFERYNKQHEIIYFEAPLNSHTVNLAQGCQAICVFVNDKLDASVIKALAAIGVQIIALRCAGFNHVDVKAAGENQITIVRVPAYSPHAVAEHALALIMTLNRKTNKAYNRVRDCNFSLDGLTGFDLFGKTVGVVGTGKIGACFAHIMLGLGCKVIAADTIASTALQNAGVSYLQLDQTFTLIEWAFLHDIFTANNILVFVK